VRLRVATYNVRSCRAGVGAVAGVVRAIDPDVLCVQEYGRRRTLRRLAHGLGMEAVSSHRFPNRLRNAVLFKVPWEVAGSTTHVLPRAGRSIPRGALVADMRSHAEALTVVCTHLSLRRSERDEQARALEALLAPVRGPVLLGGDLNEEPAGAAVRRIAARLPDAFAVAGEGSGGTLPAWGPTDRIDYVFVSAGLRVDRAWVPEGSEIARASDHRPVVAELSDA
jgi:endonuclease/exonuclease/phosphatase family metal-dependent hydrolase